MNREMRIVKLTDRSPVFIYRPQETVCHEVLPLLVRTTDGGFVMWRCLGIGCQEKETVYESEFFAIQHTEYCPQCKGAMIKSRIKYANYGFFCEGCNIAVRLADIVPWDHGIERQ